MERLKKSDTVRCGDGRDYYGALTVESQNGFRETV